MSNFQNYHDRINVILESQNKPKLSENEIRLIEHNWRIRTANWYNSDKATNHQFSLDNQLRALLTNVVYDVIATRKN